MDDDGHEIMIDTQQDVMSDKIFKRDTRDEINIIYHDKVHVKRTDSRVQTVWRKQRTAENLPSAESAKPPTGPHRFSLFPANSKIHDSDELDRPSLSQQ